MLFFCYLKGVCVSCFCNNNDCSAFHTCREVKESMHLPEGVMERMMQVMNKTSNYLVVKKNVHYDFDLHGINLRNYYNTLLEISDNCRV